MTVASVLDDAASITERPGLRAYDAVQLTGAVAIRTAEPGCHTFRAFHE